MRVSSIVIGFGVLACVWILSAGQRTPARRSGPRSRPAPVAFALAAADSRDECLGCHGPFNKIIQASSEYVAPSGEKTSPHRYMPHDSTKDQDIPECSHCHAAHPLDPLPSPGSIDLSKISVEWCYTACHHENSFTSCKECHP